MKILDRLEADWLLATEIHKLEARLWREVTARSIRSVLVTSASRGEGKSTTVAYLASAMALREDRSILAVDLDFREPSLGAHFDMVSERGLGAVFSGQCSIQDVVIKTALRGLDLVLPSAGGEDPALLFRTQCLKDALGYFRDNYDLVLLDVPALLPVADTSALLPLVDGVVLMAMAGRTTRPQLSRARDICRGMDAKILGLIVGNLQEAIPEFSEAGYGYGYGYKYGSGARSASRDGNGRGEVKQRPADGLGGPTGP
jgi:capsular exopolysaccharide synthesis family protein